MYCSLEQLKEPIFFRIAHVCDASFFLHAVNMLDRHAEKTPDKAAIIWEQDEQGVSKRISYKLVLNLKV